MRKRIQEQRDTELRLENFIISIRSSHAIVAIEEEYPDKTHEIVHVRIY
jgi:hypothetical protein